MPPLTPEQVMEKMNHQNTQADIKGVWFTIMLFGIVNLLTIFYLIDKQAELIKQIERIDNGPKSNMDGHDSSPPK